MKKLLALALLVLSWPALAADTTIKGPITFSTGLTVVGSKVTATSGGGGMNQLTGDVTAGPGTGSQAATFTLSGTSGHKFGYLDGANTWSGVQTVTNSDLALLGSSTGKTTFTSANGGASDYTLTLPAASSTVPIATQQLTFTGPTTARSYALPDAADTLAALGQAQTWTGTQTFGPVLGTINTQSGVTYTLAATDCGKTVLFTNAAAITLTTLNTLPVGCAIAVEQGGAGHVTIANGASATSVSAHSFTATFGQWAILGLFVDTNAGNAAHIVISGDGA